MQRGEGWFQKLPGAVLVWEARKAWGQASGPEYHIESFHVKGTRGQVWCLYQGFEGLDI